jgi:hypothetical protein
LVVGFKMGIYLQSLFGFSDLRHFNILDKNSSADFIYMAIFIG